MNGEAIYGTRPWTIYGEGPTKSAAGSFHDTDTAGYTAEDFRFTTKGDTLYAIELGWPPSGEAIIHSLGSSTLGASQRIASVALLGSDAKLSFRQQPDGLHIRFPAHTSGKYAYAIRIFLQRTLPPNGVK